MCHIATEIISLYKRHGQVAYGEVMDVNSHSIQAGYLAKDQGHDPTVQVAAFLHDIGHLIPLLPNQRSGKRMGKFGMDQHDLIGADYLEQAGFPQLVVACAKNHVKAKRYLCYQELDYFKQLSPASVETLRYQGGPMEKVEAKLFEQAPHFNASIAVRRLDELAKEADFMITDAHWLYFENLMAKVLEINREENNGHP